MTRQTMGGAPVAPAAHIVSRMAGQVSGREGLRTRWSPVAYAVICLIGEMKQQREERQARTKWIQERILKLHDKFAQIRQAEMRAGLPHTGNLSPLESWMVRELTAMVAAPAP